MSLIDRAKGGLRLVDYLIEVLGEPVKTGASLRWNGCPECGKSRGESRKLRLSQDGNLFTCGKCGFHGDVLQAIQACEGFSSAIEAARWVLYSSRQVTVVSAYEPGSELPRENEAMTACLSRLYDVTESTSNLSAITYLSKVRALSANVILRAKKEGMLRMLPAQPSEAISFLRRECGDELLFESGLWRKGAQAPGIAFRPLMLFFPDKKGAEFRLVKEPGEGELKAIRYGSTNGPWILKGENENTWSMTEGAIDMLSVPCLNPDYQGGVMGIPGCNNWSPEWLIGLKGKKVFICFDNDIDDPANPGARWAEKMRSELELIGAKPFIHLPKDAKDLNVMLVNRTKSTEA